jgi:hypothetical protein
MRFVLLTLFLVLIGLLVSFVGTTPGQPSVDQPGVGQPGPALGRKLFDRQGCTACHDLDGTANGGPSLHDVGLRLTPAEIRRQLVSPYRGRSVLVMYADGRSETLPLIEETDSALKVRRPGTNEVRLLKKHQLDAFSIIPSRMPSGLVQSLTREELDALVEFLTRQRKTITEVPE